MLIYVCVCVCERERENLYEKYDKCQDEIDSP